MLGKGVDGFTGRRIYKNESERLLYRDMRRVFGLGEREGKCCGNESLLDKLNLIYCFVRFLRSYGGGGGGGGYVTM